MRCAAARAGQLTAFLCLFALLASCAAQTEQAAPEQGKAGAQMDAVAGKPQDQVEIKENPGSPVKPVETLPSAAAKPPVKIELGKIEAGAGVANPSKKMAAKKPPNAVDRNAVVAEANPLAPIETATPAQVPVPLPPVLDCDNPGSAADVEACQRQVGAEPAEPDKPAEPEDYWTTPRLLISALGILGLLATLFLAGRAIKATRAAKATTDR
jgi:hypothetical protein